MSSPVLIRTVALKKTYYLAEQEVPILFGIDLEVRKGEYVALMGPSGSGKSTLMNILGCLDVPTGGEYWLNSKLVSAYDKDQLSDVRSELIGFVFQNFNLLARETAMENVELPLVYNKHGQNRKARAKRALEAVGLGHRLDHKPMEMSGGERQRVAIARALINEPQIIFADEPTGNLDSKSGTAVLGIFRELSRMGKTIVMVTHSDEVAEEASRVVWMKDGVLADRPLVKKTVAAAPAKSRTARRR